VVAYPQITQYADQDPALQAGLTGTTGITALTAALANRDAARVDIPVIGDSITEGQGATTWAGTWIQQANRAIRAAYPTTANLATGGQGFIPLVKTGETTYTWPVTVASGTNPADYSPVDLGPVRYCQQLYGTCSFTWTAPAGTTSVKIMYYDTAQAGTFTWKINAGGTTTITNAGTAADILSAGITITSGQVLTVAWASGNVYIDGIVHYAGDETSGVTFSECGHFGWNSSATPPSGWNAPETFSLNWAQCYGAFSPSALGIMLGINDANTGNLTAAQFQAALGAFIATLRGESALASLPVLLFIPYQPEETFQDSAGWPAYAQAIRGAAAVAVNTHVIDLNYRLPTVASAFGGGTYGSLYADAFHPSNLGHALVGEIAAAGVRVG
jgi:lysophospholipase L1-like esterase